ncbi:PAS domain-containing protein [Hwanghaeella sp.]|uniref:PAS domain-containing protein n=1 Tax=Hwanghaeella sp. TaxID=2605943 RepID=UPI003CCC41F5
MAISYTDIPESIRFDDESFLDECDPRIVTLVALWRSRFKSDALPARRDIEPHEIVKMLPDIMLVDVVQPGPDFRYRLVGTREVEFRGYDPTGRSVRDAFAGFDGNFCDGNYRSVVDRRAPVFIVEYAPTKLGAVARRETVFLPFAGDGQTVDIVMVFSVTDLSMGDTFVPQAELLKMASGE